MKSKKNILLFGLLGGAAGLFFLLRNKNKKNNEILPINKAKDIKSGNTKLHSISKGKKKTSKPSIKDIFKYKIGSELISNPKTGFSKVPYYFDPRETKVMKVAFWHVLSGGYVGKVIDRMRHEVINADGKKVTVNLYSVSDVPATFLSRQSKLWVLEKDVERKYL